MTENENFHPAHIPTRLASGKWTCLAGDIHASDDERDVLIHIIWTRDEALRKIADCPDSNSVENCHDLMHDIAAEAC